MLLAEDEVRIRSSLVIIQSLVLGPVATFPPHLVVFVFGGRAEGHPLQLLESLAQLLLHQSEVSIDHEDQSEKSIDHEDQSEMSIDHEDQSEMSIGHGDQSEMSIY